MGKTGKWIRNFLSGKKEKIIVNQATLVGNGNPTTPLTIPSTTPKEKKRWSFRRSSATEPGQDLKINSTDINGGGEPTLLESDDDHKKHAFAMATATAAAADAAMAAVKAAAIVIQLNVAASGRATTVDEAAAIKIQSYYRAYLARKALNALKGLVKLQALVRGHLVRNQAAATLRCMEALVTLQSKARAQRLAMVEESKPNNQTQFHHRKSTQENRTRPSNQDFGRGIEEDVKIVEMDLGEWSGSTKGRNPNSNHGQTERFEHRISINRAISKQELQQISPSPSAVTDLTLRADSGRFDDCSFDTAQTSPPYYAAVSKPDPSRATLSYARSEHDESLSNDHPFYPSYMANTKSSRAKVRSQSAPKQRPELFNRQLNRRTPTIEGRNVPRGVKMQRSSSKVGSTAQNQQFPWSIKLDRSTFSLKGSESGSTSTILTNTNYCRSLVGFDVHGNRY